LFDNVQNLTEAIHKKYGYNFADYSADSFQRRLNSFMIRFAVSDLDELEKKVLNDDHFFNKFLEEITVNVTEMFRDPEFFKTLREEIIPQFAHHPPYPHLARWMLYGRRGLFDGDLAKRGWIFGPLIACMLQILINLFSKRRPREDLLLIKFSKAKKIIEMQAD
jgi:hypothetical protein